MSSALFVSVLFLCKYFIPVMRLGSQKEGIKSMIVKCDKNSSLCIAFTISQVLGFSKPFKSSTQVYFLRRELMHS